MAAPAPRAGSYCGRCGKPNDEGDHFACYRALRLEPPRYCNECARRMVVQVTPNGWNASCGVHGSALAGRVPPEPVES